MRNASEASIHSSSFTESYAVEHGWSWFHLKRQIERKNATGLYEKYRLRIHHAMFMVGLMMNASFNLILLIFYLTLAKSASDVRILGSLRAVGVAVNGTLLVLSCWERWFRGEGARLAASILVLLAMMAGEQSYSLAVLLMDGASTHKDVRLTFYVLLVAFIFLPFPKLVHTTAAALTVVAAELALSVAANFYTVPFPWKVCVANVTFYLLVMAIGFYLKYLIELTNRRAFLESVGCFESKCNLDLQKEQAVSLIFDTNIARMTRGLFSLRILYPQLIYEQLLLSILPPHISDKVKADLRHLVEDCRDQPADFQQRPFDHLYVERHQNVTILYADIVNSMLLMAGMDANELVETLNELFGKFDECIVKHRCLRIKLLGDCYYCVSGIPEQQPGHADNCVRMGLDMIGIIRQVRDERQVDVDMRIGIHSGNVLSGLLGLHKWQYDIWSHDVTVASRMEHCGKPG
ncbi:ADCY7 [Cordylochernes scorpioides]|uniref:adenylate cyclase n=1 Tax=Cordylochernes scorpioides TaxID=51811 RepID=A0ABY6K6X9_9ARAC|nr:ADCY7 [Cordylochernes scorpioides]